MLLSIEFPVQQPDGTVAPEVHRTPVFFLNKIPGRADVVGVRALIPRLIRGKLPAANGRSWKRGATIRTVARIEPNEGVRALRDFMAGPVEKLIPPESVHRAPRAKPIC
ncbi:hypothetical protein [Paraburkholderia sp. J8-2]|uniref:hypothetical protein n=1 Tax=Paraburkholderia sp. J8-2 TaxID=2805440 RepID=UPI002AB6A7FA|nr:hypothetical protein [Paraburkholderia sp. J8-2]